MCLWEIGGHDLNFRKIKRFTCGFTILEIISACVLIAFIIIPIYKALTSTAAQEIETTKLSIARKICESLRQEMTGHTWTELKGITDTQGIFPGGSSSNFVEVGEVGIPQTVKDYITHQKTFKDFRLKMELRYKSASVLECRGTVEWTSGNQNITKSEEIQFLMVEP
jgi:hypothetical protein